MPTTNITTSATVPQTIEWIRRLIVAGAGSPQINSLIKSVQSDKNHIESAFNELWHTITFVPDPLDRQDLKTVQRMFESNTANCANYTILLGALLMTLGKDFCLRVTSYSSDKIPEHIYIMMGDIPLDLTLGQTYLEGCETIKDQPLYGVEQPNPTYVKDYCFDSKSAIKIIARENSNIGRTRFIRTWQ